MPQLPAKLRPRRLVGVALAIGLIAATAGVAAALVPADPGPFTGCLASKTVTGTPATKGQIYNVAKGTAPIAACNKNDIQVAFSNANGPAGADGAPGATGAPGPTGAPGTNGTNGAPGVSKSFWSGRTSDSRSVTSDDRSVRASLAETGPLPSDWWTITGQLSISVADSDADVKCSLMASSRAQGTTGEFNGGFIQATLYDATVVEGSTVTVPIRTLIHPGAGSIANVQCTESSRGLLSTVTLAGDLLVIPTEEGQIGIAP